MPVSSRGYLAAVATVATEAPSSGRSSRAAAPVDSTRTATAGRPSRAEEAAGSWAPGKT